MIGNISMLDFAKQIYKEVGVRPSYNEFALFQDTVLSDGEMLGRLFLYRTVNRQTTIKEVRKKYRISLLKITKHFIMIFNHDTQSPELYVKGYGSDVIREISRRGKVLTSSFQDDFLFMKADDSIYLITKSGLTRKVRVTGDIPVKNMWIKKSTEVDGYNIYAGTQLLYTVDKHLNKVK